jgi:dihydropteroate synthase
MYSLNCKGRLIEIIEPMVMGIINTTPDSFYAGSRVSADDVLFRAGQMIEDGATILDIGGQSTRPGSTKMEADEELKRVIPAIESICKVFPQAVISIDTYYAKVAQAAIEAGASIINDVSAGSIDEELIPLAASMQVPYILMHMLGNPQTMQKDPTYDNVVLEVFDFLSFKIAELQKAGINDIIIDPGFGFGKKVSHNFEILRNLDYFKNLDKPVMVGLSRKATIYKTLGVSASEALNGTTVINTISLLNGASILRVHDVKEAVQAVKLFSAYKNKEQY